MFTLMIQSLVEMNNPKGRKRELGQRQTERQTVMKKQQNKFKGQYDDT